MVEITETQLACARENRKRNITERLVLSKHFAMEPGVDRDTRLRRAYDLACEIDSVLTWAWENP